MSSVTTPASEAEVLERAVAGRYSIERELGRGGMGVVYLARDLTLDRLVAIKLLPPVLAAQPELRERFLRETRTAARLSHPNIVPIHAVEERDGLVYYVMGFIDGESLTERVRRVGPLPPDEVARVLQEAAEALGYAHQHGIVHRDVKADNILLERGTGRAFLTDFGIARVADSTMTMAGQSLGTPQYMSPEQAAGETVDARSDLYSLGIVGFFALTGNVPFTAPTVAAILAMQVTREPPPVASVRADVPPKLAEVIDRCLRKDPDARWSSGADLAGALRAAQGAAGVEIAGPVRNFQRMAEMASVQIITIVGALPIMILAEARLPLVLTYVVASLVVLGMQFVGRTRDLVARGYTHEDVRAAFALEMRRREEESEQQGGGAARGGEVWRIVLPVAVGSAMIGAGVAVAGTTHAATPSGVVAVMLISGGAALAILGLVRRQDRWQRFDRRYARAAARLWTGPFGRVLFRLLARGAKAGAPREAAAMSGAQGTHTVLALLEELPAARRRPLRELRAVLRELDRKAASLAARKQELARALADASASPLVSPPAAAAAGSGDGVDGALGGAAASTGATARHTALVTELETAQHGVAAERAAILNTLEGFRLHLIRLRSGVGRAEDLTGDIAAARKLLEAAS